MKMYLILLNLCVLCLPFSNGMVMLSSSGICHDKELKMCVIKAEDLLNSENTALAADPEQKLTESCKKANESLSCIDDYVHRCFDSIMRETYKIMTTGAHDLLSDICTEGSDFRKEYLKHAPCFRSVSKEYRQCAADFVLEHRIITVIPMNIFERLKRQCCLFDRYVHCAREAVSNKCSDEAADMSEKIFRKLVGPAVESYCASYKHRSPKCLAISPNSGSGFLTSSSYDDFAKRFDNPLLF